MYRCVSVYLACSPSRSFREYQTCKAILNRPTNYEIGAYFSGIYNSVRGIGENNDVSFLILFI